MTRYLVDTNHLGDAVRKVSRVRDRIQRQHRQGDVFGTCGPVLCELMVGVFRRKDAKPTRRRLAVLLDLVRIWPVDMAVADHYGEIYGALQTKGRALSQVDMMLGAMCRQSNLVLLTTDTDFHALPDIRTEDWLGG